MFAEEMTTILLCWGIKLLLLLCSVNAQDCQSVNDSQSLEFLYMTSFGASLNSSGSVVGMMMALDKINRNSSLLPNYTLGYSSIVDSQCNRSVSLSQFFQAVNDPCRNFIAVIGSGCSVATEPVAEIDHFWGLSHISYASSAGHFEDTTRFRKYLQIYPTEDSLAPAVTAIIEFFEWTQVGVITQREQLFIRSHELIRKQLDDIGVTILSTTSFLESFINPATIRNLFPEDARVFFLNAYEDKARQILCQAYLQGLYGQNYLWILFGWYDEKWWEEEGDFPCSSPQLYDVIEGSVAVQHYPVNDNTNKKVVGDISYNEFLKEYSYRVARSQYIEAYNSHLAYDAVWTLAFALDRVVKLDGEVTAKCLNAKIQDSFGNWSYFRNATTACLVYEELLKTDFEGLSGQISFNENGIRFKPSVRLLQYRNGYLVPFGYFNESVIVFINGESAETIFPDGVPLDGRPVSITTTVHSELLGVIYTLAILGILLTLVCTVFIIVVNWRNKRLANIASDVSSYCLMAGVAMVCVSLLFYNRETDPTIITAFCFVQQWFSILGFVIIYSAILAQMWRIYYMHLNPDHKSSLKAWHLLGIVGSMTLLMAILLLLGSVIPSIRADAYLENDLENPSTVDSTGVVKDFKFYKCHPPAANVWFAVVFAFLGILQISELVLIVQTRKVKISDVKTMAVMIYATTLVYVALLIVRFAFNGYQNATVALFAAGFISISYTIIVVTFVQKLVMMYKGDMLKQTYSQSSLPVTTTDHESTNNDKKSSICSANGAEDALRIVSLNQELDELKSLIELKKKTNS